MKKIFNKLKTNSPPKKAGIFNELDADILKELEYQAKKEQEKYFNQIQKEIKERRTNEQTFYEKEFIISNNIINDKFINFNTII